MSFSRHSKLLFDRSPKQKTKHGRKVGTSQPATYIATRLGGWGERASPALVPENRRASTCGLHASFRGKLGQPASQMPRNQARLRLHLRANRSIDSNQPTARPHAEPTTGSSPVSLLSPRPPTHFRTPSSADSKILAWRSAGSWEYMGSSSSGGILPLSKEPSRSASTWSRKPFSVSRRRRAHGYLSTNISKH